MLRDVRDALRHPRVLVLLAMLAGLPGLAAPAAAQAAAAPVPAPAVLGVEPAGASLAGGALHLEITVSGAPAPLPVTVEADGFELGRFELADGEHTVAAAAAGLPGGTHRVVVSAPGAAPAEAEVRVVPGWLSVVPPLVAIVLALVFKEVVVSLFLGILSGTLILTGYDPFAAFARSVDGFIAPALYDSGHAQIVVFSLLLGGMVGIITRSGGSRGIVERLAPWATDPRRGQLATWVMGIAIFFDDYANTLIVGSTMRPITDRLRVSREKLAYMVDSTAAPVASLVPISTWIGFEVGLIADAFASRGIEWNAYAAFVASIPYRFYPIFALVLGFTIAASRRDLGPMLAAERRAAATGEVLAPGDRALADYQAGALAPPEEARPRAVNAIAPIATVIVVTLVGLWVTGAAAVSRADYATTGAWLRDVFGNADSFAGLLWASLAGVVVAAALPVAQRILRVREAMEAMLEGFKAMLLAMVVLVLAWSIGAVAGELHTAEFLVGITEGVLSPRWLPVLVFLLSAGTAFATGTSWGTMGILVPLVIPVAHGLALAAGLEPGSGTYETILLGAISSILAGSVWGDHCSPISDTTILSSMASGSDHIAHVRTQLPYALGAGVLGMLVGDVPTAFGLPPWISILVGSAVIVAVVLWLGRRSDRAPL